MTDRAQDTRSRLVDTAAELVWERSFHSTGIGEICRRARAQKGSFYHFFPSKTDLAIEAVREKWAHVRRECFEPAFVEREGGLAQLQHIVETVDRLQRREFNLRGVYLGCPFGAVGQEMAHQDERLQAAVDEVFQAHADYFQRALEVAVDAGEVEPGDLRQRAQAVLALMEGALLVAKVANRPDRFTEVIRALPLVVAHDAT